MAWGGGKTDSFTWLDICYPHEKSFLDLKM